MGQLIDGKWTTENVLVNHDEKGLYFKRDSVFRNRISNEPGSGFPAPKRYLIWGPRPIGGRGPFAARCESSA